jgi:hypothetical protein
MSVDIIATDVKLALVEMFRGRRLTSFVAVGWLVCQLVALAVPLAPISSDDQCACPGGTLGTMCPMHHHANPASANPSGTTVKNACSASATPLLSLAGGLGVLPQPAPIDIDRVQTAVGLFISTPVDRTSVPDSPPPRA